MDQEVIKLTVKIGDEDKNIEIRKPSPKIEAEANMEASKVFNKLVRQKDEDNKPTFILRAQLNGFLSDLGVYTSSDIRDIGTLSEKIETLEAKLTKGGITKSEGRKLALDLRATRFAVYTLLMKQVEYDKNTVEHYADNARMDYYISKCICYEGGVPIFKNVEDYLSDSVMQKLLREPIKILAGMVSQYDSNFENNLVENRFLKKYGFCDDKYRLIDKDGNFVDGDGNPVDSEGNPIEVQETKIEIGEFLDDEIDQENSPKPKRRKKSEE